MLTYFKIRTYFINSELFHILSIYVRKTYSKISENKMKKLVTLGIEKSFADNAVDAVSRILLS